MTLSDAHPVMQVVYSATAMGIRNGAITVVPYERQGGARSGDHGGASPA